MTSGTSVELTLCRSCHLRFLPSDGPCPKCGSSDLMEISAPGVGKVLAATELQYPAAGWQAPHRLALVELADSVRVLTVVDGPVPAPGTLVEVHLDRDVYHARPEPIG